jgi:hypothetical protein
LRVSRITSIGSPVPPSGVARIALAGITAGVATARIVARVAAARISLGKAIQQLRPDLPAAHVQSEVKTAELAGKQAGKK